MRKLDTVLKLSKELILSPNLTDRFSEDDLTSIGNSVFEGYQQDCHSRHLWSKRTQAAMDLATQLQQEKSFPWSNCSNVAFPLVTIAALQFHSRAYPAILTGADVVRCRVIGEDPEGIEQARADRISSHMSYQVLEEDQSWEDQHDRLLINIPIVGCAFKKTYYSSAEGHNTSELVLAQDFVLDYYAKSVESCARKTQVILAYRNELYEGVLEGRFHNFLEESWFLGDAVPQVTPQESRRDKRTGETPPQTDQDTPFTILEQHCWRDFDQDGYAEPYIITIEANSKQVLRIVTRFDSMNAVVRTTKGAVIRIEATEHFTKYPFIPSPFP